ncbi:ankyrin repeat domain-containing protein EMB506, chloroplastic-like [Humulus lupulus]|uniref:ankyrin repeat domain-containing protein EMB506, chloroplastic-like n=1 Tax=Humulus lupulus TaxID=3486 RepID=UPI002B41168A|nr:ankyrin repeat domain-containing protein EMB506, chloroplastic-like [Humulus lupulus]
MATLSLSALHSISTRKPIFSFVVPSSSPVAIPCRNTRLRSYGVAGSSRCWIALTANSNKSRGVTKVRSVEEETLVLEQEEEQATTQQEGEGEAASPSEQQAVSVPVSASDTLTMFYQADGTMSEAGIPRVVDALEQIQGVSNLKVNVIEGIASVEIMASSCTMVTCTPYQLPLCSTVGSSRWSTNFLRVYSPRRGISGLFFRQKHSNMKTFAMESNQVSSLKPHQVTWEDPDDGSDSEDEEEEEENNLDFESDWEEEKNDAMDTSVGIQNSQRDTYEEDLVKEVEQLLGPEERAILFQSSTPNLEKISTEKWFPLHTLALSGQIPFLDELLEQGVDIDFVDKDGLTALHTTVIGNKVAVISHLLRKGASPHIKDKDGATPLHYATQVGSMQTVKLLIKYNVDLNVADNEEWTPLHIAVQTRNRDIVKVLLLNGADANRRNKDGKTPLDLSLCYGKDFKSYDLASLLKVIPANRET